MRSILVLPTLAVLSACGGVDPETWPQQAAKSNCNFTLRCSAANFYYTFDDMKDCREQTESALQDETDSALDDDCEFKETQARECLDGLDQSCKNVGADFEAVFEPCTEVWECPDVFRGGGGDDTGA